MELTLRRYKLYSDFPKVCHLLRDNFGRYHENGNVPGPRWEYEHTHPAFNHKLTHRFGIWEDSGELVGVASYVMDLGEALLTCRKGYEALKLDMVEYAERELSREEDGRHTLELTVWDQQKELRECLAQRGYTVVCSHGELVYEYSKGFPETPLPEGYSITSLAEENDLKQINSVLWRGFDHGDQPDGDCDGQLQMQSAPSFSPELTTIVKAPNGDYACYAGMWLDGVNDFAYLEPLATDPAHRRKGLASAALVEGMRKTQARGATYCIGGSREFYWKLGFTPTCTRELWKREW